MTSHLRTKTTIIALAAIAAVGATGCYARFDVDATRARYQAAGAAPPCAEALVEKQEAHNRHARWSARTAVAGLVLGAAVGVVALATSRDTPGEGAADVSAAVDAERGFSGLELGTAGIAVLAGADAVLHWYSTARMSQRAREVAELGDKCPTPTP
jgi:hypothetical protein